MTGGDALFSRFGQVFAPGEVIFREGEPGEHMYVLQSGHVRITRDNAAGARVLAVLGAGEFFGEMSILNDKPRNATADALDEVRALVLDGKMFEAMVIGNTEIAIRLIKKLSRRLDSANALIEILLQQDPRVRVILGLSRVAEEFGTAMDEGVFVPTTTEQLAAQIGLDEGRVVEVMSRLARLKILYAVAEGGWIIREPARLQEFLEFLEMRDRVE
jgi:CRP-like cAMP-binding protein